MSPEESKPRSRTEPVAKGRTWLQFRLRTLLLVTAILAVCLSLIVTPVHRRREAVQKLQRSGAGICYGSAWEDGGRHDMGERYPGPDWLRALLGEDFFFGDVTGVVFHNAEPTNEDLEPLLQLPNLKLFESLDGRRITSDGFALLCQIDTLELLRLADAEIGDNDLQALRNLSQLERLDLRYMPVSDAGLDFVLELPKLRSLALYGTNVTDRGIDTLRRLPKLRFLTLYGTNVTDRGVDTLRSRLPNLNVHHRAEESYLECPGPTLLPAAPVSLPKTSSERNEPK